MSSTTKLIKILRSLTGAGIKDCNIALKETEYDLDKAIEALRKKGIDKAAKKGSRVAAEGLIQMVVAGQSGILLELNSETDFVSRNQSFVDFSKELAQLASQHDVTTVEAFLELPFNAEQTVEQARQTMVAKIGENILIRRLLNCRSESGSIASYMHGARIGVLVDYEGDAAVARDVAMHIAANQPLAVKPEDVEDEAVEKERQVYLEQAAESGKPQAIQEKIVAGKLKKFLAEVTLLSQPFVKDTDVTVGEYLNKNQTKITAFYRLSVGEGVEIIKENFAVEVAKMTEE